MKTVYITIGGKLYCRDVFGGPCESPLKLIDLSNAKIDPKLDGFFIDNYTLDQFKKINELIISNKNIEDELKEFRHIYQYIYQNREIEKELRIKYINEINDKIESFNKRIELLSKDNNNDNFELKLAEIKKLILLDEFKEIKNAVNRMKIKKNILAPSNCNYDVDFSLDNLLCNNCILKFCSRKYLKCINFH